MTLQEERGDAAIQLKKRMRAKVRKHRPAAKVLEFEVMMVEEELAMLDVHRKDLEWKLDYLRGLDPTETEKEEVKR